MHYSSHGCFYLTHSVYCDFSPWHQMVPQQTPKFRTARFRQFRNTFEEG